MLGELRRIARQCDGVRCDMAMLVLPEVFERTWGIAASPFWPGATEAVREKAPGFLFLAEVYWDLEWTLQQQGFDYTYDKRLYDRLVEGHARPAREHLYAGLDFQDHLARFLENHDEPRAAATFAPEVHRGRRRPDLPHAGPSLLPPGPAGGQAGAHPRPPRPRAGRGPRRPGSSPSTTASWSASRTRPSATATGSSSSAVPPGTENGTSDSFVAFSWTGAGERRLVAVNYADHRSQCYVTMPWRDLDGPTWRLQDLVGPSVYDRRGGDLTWQGLYLDMPAWGYHVFAVSPAE